MAVINNVFREDEDVLPQTREELIKLVDYIWSNTYFRFGEKYYQQINGSPIGGSFSPVAAELFMEHFEQQLRDKIRDFPKVFYRYVDMFLIWKGGEDCLYKFLDIFNQ